MALSSPLYPALLFAVVVFVVYLPQRWKLLFLLLVSYVFYAALGGFWYVLPWVTAVGFLGGLTIARLPEHPQRTVALIIAITGALAPLLLFKYSAKALAVSQLLFGGHLAFNELILPVGLSFFTFTTVGYLIDVYVGSIAVEKSWSRFALFVSFFPQVTQGPIGRAAPLLPQISNAGKLQYRNMVAGLRLMLLGMFMKIVIADTLSPYVNEVYANPVAFGGADQAVATFYFAFQVYADFAGYSLIAIGSARILGVELLTNFAQPYLSRSVPEFWRRWHISLSSWFRDYVFVPVQAAFRRRPTPSVIGALVFTFFLVGVWHGAGIKFAIFGIVHGVLVAGSTFTIRGRTRFWKNLRVPSSVLVAGRTTTTFLIVTSTLVLFRANNISDVALIYRNWAHFRFGSVTLHLLLPLSVVATTLCCDILAYQEQSIDRLHVAWRWTIYYATVLTIAFFIFWHAAAGSNYAQQFIYFKF